MSEARGASKLTVNIIVLQLDRPAGGPSHSLRQPVQLADEEQSQV